MLNPALAVAAEFEVTCGRDSTEIVWTPMTTETVLNDGTNSPISLTALDDSIVVLTSDLGNQLVFKENRAIYNGVVEATDCMLKIISTDIAQSTDQNKEDLLRKIEDLERRVIALENVECPH